MKSARESLAALVASVTDDATAGAWLLALKSALAPPPPAAPAPPVVTREEALEALLAAVDRIQDVPTLRALAWIAHWYAKAKLNTDPWYNREHGAVEVHDAFGLAITSAATAIAHAQGYLGIVRASHDLPPGGPPREWTR